MNDLRDMYSERNSLKGIKKKFRGGVIGNLNYIRDNQDKIHKDWQITFGSSMTKKSSLRSEFANRQSQICMDESLGSNPRWGIVALKNFFGLQAEVFPEYGKDKEKKIILHACAGRFQAQKFPIPPTYIFPKTMDISDILERSEEEQVREIEEFYNMTNREVFEKFGVHAENKYTRMLLANCVVLDSLLKGKYEDLKSVYCWSPGNDGNYTIQIELKGGTKIESSVTNEEFVKGIAIKRDGKEAEVTFDAISTGEEANTLTNINELEVENVEYRGALELITELQQAMQEQFESQRQRVQSPNDIIVPEHENYYERYEAIASKLLDKAGVCSYDEDYELDGLAISCINGMSVCIKSDTLGITFFADGDMCTFFDLDNLVKVEYPSREGESSQSIEEKLNNLEKVGPQNKKIIERVKKFVEKLEELARDERINETTNLEETSQPNNGVLIKKIVAGEVKVSDVQGLQQILIRGAKQSKDKTTLDENDFLDEEGK